MKRAYFSAFAESFSKMTTNEILGEITRNNTFPLTQMQKTAWIKQLNILKAALVGREGKVYLEFSIPRMGKRIDVVLIIGAVIFIIEFKVGSTVFEVADIDQVTDYALDMKNFHEGSHEEVIVPILVATDGAAYVHFSDQCPADGLFDAVCCNANSLGIVVDHFVSLYKATPINYSQWEKSGYKPTPTIIEATLALYNGHSVYEISRSDSSAINLSTTSAAAAEIISRSRKCAEKSIIFITGVPGAGKTLVGLNIATTHINKDDDLYSVFLSGNGPLVKILQEALARDRVARSNETGGSVTKGDALREAKGFIQNVHHFRDEGLRDPDNPPIEHVVIFDEAQRAWDLEQTSKFMREKKDQAGFGLSEPEFLISCMDRHVDWSVVICLVGGGQEINTGEAGIVEWFSAIKRSFPHWRIYLSGQLTDSEYGAGKIIDEAEELSTSKFVAQLHLNTSVRSFRSEKVSLFVKQLLDLKTIQAKENLISIQRAYPIVLTRSFETAKEWLRVKARGTERYGMVVSSQAERLRPYAIDVRVKPNPVHWFLNGKDDVRSSYYLEDVATEFDVQGLELDWVCVAWDADFRYNGNGWSHWSFRGSRWQRIIKEERQIYQKNAYRVLMTRARQGMVMVVPEGDDKDFTRPKKFYDGTYRYLKSLGLPVI